MGDSEDGDSLASINAQLTSLGIRAMDLTTMDEIVNYVENNIISDAMVDELNQRLDDVE